MVVGGKIEIRPMMYLALVLRSPHRRRPRGGDLPGAREGSAGGSGAAGAGSVSSSSAVMRRASSPAHPRLRIARKTWMPGTSPGMTIESAESSHVLRSHRHRHRPRRLCLRHPRGAARPEDRRGREARAPSAAPASTSAASRRRRCCTPPSCSRRPATRSPRWASASARRSSISPTMLKFKDEAVDGNVKGVDFLLKKNKIDAVRGTGRIAAPGKVEVKAADGKTQTLETKNIVIATGSDVAPLPGIEIDEKRIVVVRPARSRCDKVPEQLLVIGAGVIGLELGSVWRRLGAQGDGGRIPRPHPARHGRRGRPSSSQRILRKAGHRVQARRPRSPASMRPATALKATRRAGRGRRGGDDRGRRRAGRDRPRALHRRARPRGGRRRDGQARPRRRSTRITPPTCRASTPSAT